MKADEEVNCDGDGMKSVVCWMKMDEILKMKVVVKVKADVGLNGELWMRMVKVTTGVS